MVPPPTKHLLRLCIHLLLLLRVLHPPTHRSCDCSVPHPLHDLAHHVLPSLLLRTLSNHLLHALAPSMEGPAESLVHQALHDLAHHVLPSLLLRTLSLCRQHACRPHLKAYQKGRICHPRQDPLHHVPPPPLFCLLIFVMLYGNLHFVFCLCHPKLVR